MTHDYKAALDYFLDEDTALSKGFGFKYYSNSCPYEIRRIVVSSLLEKLPITEKRAEYAFRPFKVGFKDGVNGQSFTLNREQVAIICSSLQLAQGAEQLRKERDDLADAVVRYKEGGWWGHADRIISTYQLAKKVSEENGNA